MNFVNLSIKVMQIHIVCRLILSICNVVILEKNLGDIVHTITNTDVSRLMDFLSQTNN